MQSAATRTFCTCTLKARLNLTARIAAVHVPLASPPCAARFTALRVAHDAAGHIALLTIRLSRSRKVRLCPD